MSREGGSVVGRQGTDGKRGAHLDTLEKEAKVKGQVGTVSRALFWEAEDPLARPSPDTQSAPYPWASQFPSWNFLTCIRAVCLCGATSNMPWALIVLDSLILITEWRKWSQNC